MHWRRAYDRMHSPYEACRWVLVVSAVALLLLLFWLAGLLA